VTSLMMPYLTRTWSCRQDVSEASTLATWPAPQS